MTTIELKKLLIHRIEEINDESILYAVNTILDCKTERKVLLLSAELNNEIMESRKEIEEGLFVEQENLDMEILKWVNVT